MKLLNEEVCHEKYGYGVITDFQFERITVQFEGKMERKFPYPEAFFSHLKIKNHDLIATIKKDHKTKQQNIKEARAKIQQELQLESQQPPLKKPRSTSSKSKLADDKPSNVAFKCVYCDGGQSAEQIGYGDICSDATRTKNIQVEKHVCCSSSDCPCKHYYDGQITRETLEDLGATAEFPCDASKLLQNWRVLTGNVQSGVRKGKNISLRNIQANKLCILTTRPTKSPEKDRFIFAVFLIDEFHQGDDKKEGYVASQSKYRIKLSPDEARGLLFWSYHMNKNQSDLIRWGSGLHRYFDDTIGAQILHDVMIAKKNTADESLSEEFFTHYCQINKIDPTQLTSPMGALNTTEK